jgi:hypothetical protein
MANVRAIHSVGSSLATYLNNTYPEPYRSEHPCTFRLRASGEMLKPDDNDGTIASLFLYRVIMNEHLRNAGRGLDPGRRAIPLSVDLHYLLTVWADNALEEHTILAWAMLQLHQHPVLDASSLSPEAGWSSGDVIQLIPAELSTEDIMRIWDALEPPYRLSVSYIARVVRIDPDSGPDGRPVVATRFSLTDREALP